MAGVGFRWLDILEKEFDKAFVDLDVAIGEFDAEEPDLVCNVRQKMSTLSSCFAQLTHKAQTIFQNSAKIEAELIHMRAELIDSKSKREILEQELHTLLLQLHSAQLSHLPGLVGGRTQDSKIEPDVNIIKKKLQDELKKSPSHRISKEEELKFSTNVMELSQLRAENSQLLSENSSLRNSILSLNSEVYGAKLAAKYLDKELAGRIQQLQLLGREMRGEIRDKLWRQLESEILLQRHKTVVRACRRNSNYGGGSTATNNCTTAGGKGGCPKPDITLNENGQDIGEIRSVLVKRKSGQGLGISITGGREHGVPILISELEPNGPAALCANLYIGDAILSVNGVDLRQTCHREAVDILQKQSGDCRLEVQYIAADDSDNSLSEDGYNFHYRFFDSEVCETNDGSQHPYGVMNTPTAPRTPESQNQSRIASGNNSRRDTPSKVTINVNSNQLSVPPVPVPLSVPSMVDNKLIEVKSFETGDIQTEETITVTDNLIDITNDIIIQNPINDNATVNLLPSDMIDLNSNPNLNSNIEASVVNNIITCDSPTTKKLITDIGNRLFETILEPILNPLDNCHNDNENDNEFVFNKNTYIENTTTLDNRHGGGGGFMKKEDNFNCSTNSLVSENLSSPMQTSTDNMIDSELASNDSHSPKSMQNLNTNTKMKNDNHQGGNANNQSTINYNYGHSLLEMKKFNEFCSSYEKPKMYSSNETFSNPKSDQSLLNSAESCDSSPVHKMKVKLNKDYIARKQSKKHKSKKTFGVKTLQAIFNKNDGYSDISSTNSDFGDESYSLNDNKIELHPITISQQQNTHKQVAQKLPQQSKQETMELVKKSAADDNTTSSTTTLLNTTDIANFLSKPILTDISPQFEKNIHTFLSETFEKKQLRTQNAEVNLPNFSVSNIGNKKYFMYNGHNVRVGKALRLCPNEDLMEKNLAGENLSPEQKIAQREKLLARYVYNTNSVNVDGIGDPDFGTPV